MASPCRGTCLGELLTCVFSVGHVTCLGPRLRDDHTCLIAEYFLSCNFFCALSPLKLHNKDHILPKLKLKLKKKTFFFFKITSLKCIFVDMRYT